MRQSHTTSPTFGFCIASPDMVDNLRYARLMRHLMGGRQLWGSVLISSTCNLRPQRTSLAQRRQVRTVPPLPHELHVNFIA
jgi:hypothetical protein